MGAGFVVAPPFANAHSRPTLALWWLLAPSRAANSSVFSGIRYCAFAQNSNQLRVVAVNMARPEGTGFASHTKTLMKEVSLRNQLEASCQDGERFGEWFETPSYEEGARG